MSTERDLPDGLTDDSPPRPEGDGFFALRVRERDGVLWLFNMGRPAPQLPDQCEAFALAVAHQLRTRGRFPPFPDTRLDIEDQDRNLLAYAVVQPWAEQPEFALYSPAGDLLITWPPAGGRVA